jgi:hypothetical protein
MSVFRIILGNEVNLKVQSEFIAEFKRQLALVPQSDIERLYDDSVFKRINGWLVDILRREKKHNRKSSTLTIANFCFNR